MSRGSRARAGFSLVEVMIAFSILTLISVNVGMVMKTSSTAYQSGILRTILDEQAAVTMDRITLAVMSASADHLTPSAAAPMSSSSLDFQTNLGFQNGAMVMGPPERIALLEGATMEVPGQVQWTENVGQAGQRSVIWSSWVAPRLDGESANGVDDNGNALVDEPGLSFTTVGPRVDIRMTLLRKDTDGATFKRTLTSKVTCRN